MSTEEKELTKEEIYDELNRKTDGSISHKNLALKAMSKYAAQEVAKEREKAKQIIEALEGLYVGHRFTATFENNEAQSKYNESLRNAKEAIKTYKHG